MSDRMHVKRRGFRAYAGALGIVAGWLALASVAHAQILDDIEVRDGGELAEIRIGFNLPMRYQAHFPEDHGELLRISFQAIALDDPEIMRRKEYKKSPPNNLIPAFTVTYSYQDSCYAVKDPVCLVIQFDKPVSFTVRQSQDNRSFYLYVPILRDQPHATTKPSP